MPLPPHSSGALAQSLFFGTRAPGLLLSPNLRYAALRPLRKRPWGVCGSIGPSAFGPHRQGRDREPGSPRTPSAVRTEAASAGSLSLQQRRLQQLWDIAVPSHSSALEAADAALLELRQIRERLSAAGPGPTSREPLIACPEPQTANAIVPAGGRVLGRRAGLVQPVPWQQQAEEEQQEQEQALGEEQQQQQQQAEPPAPKRRGRRKKEVPAEGTPAAVSAAPQPAASAAAPKRRGRPPKAASLGSSLQSLAAPAPQPAGEGGEVAVAPRRRGRKPTAATSLQAADVMEQASALPAPAPRRGRPSTKAAAAPSARASNGAALDQILETVAQLAASVGLSVMSGEQQQQQAAVPSSSSGSSSGGGGAGSPAAAPSAVAAAAVAAAEPSVAKHTRLVRSTRASGHSPSRSEAAAAAPAALTPQVGRRTRLLLRAPQPQPADGDMAAASAQQQQQAVAAGEEQQLTEGQRDAAFLAKMRATLQKGRRKKRTSVTDSLTMFLSRMGHTPVLGKEQEGRLARILQKGRRVRAAAAEAGQRLGREPSPAELAAEAGLPRGEGELRLENEVEAKDLLVQYNLRLVVHIAKKYCNQGLELSDLIQEGELGLRKSIDRYDPDRGFRFSTYAHWYIRQPISRAVAEQGRDVRLPVHVCEAVNKIYRTEAELNKDPTRSEPATKEELARALGMPLPRLLQFLRLARAPRVVERHGSEATMLTPSMKEMTLDEQWEDDESSEQVEGVNKHEFMKQNVSFILSTLPKRERNILRLRYGLLQYDDDEDASGGSSVPLGMGPGPAGTAGGAAATNDYHSFAEPDGLALAAMGGAGGSSSGGYQYVPQLQRAAVGAQGAGAGSGSYGSDRLPEALSLTEVSWAYGLSKERIRQIEDRALRALRNPWRVRLLHEINNGNRLSAGTLAHLAAAARPLKRGGGGGDSSSGAQIS